MESEVKTLNANYFAITRGIIAHALQMVELLGNPCAKLEEWLWKAHPAQKAMLLYTATANFTELLTKVDCGDVKLPDCPWTVMGIALKTTMAAGEHVIELWHSGKHILSIENLALPPSWGWRP